MLHTNRGTKNKNLNALRTSAKTRQNDHNNTDNQYQLKL